jgi:hypothetical protein
VEELIGALNTAGVLKEAEDRGRALIAEARQVFTTLPGAPQVGEARAEEARRLLSSFADLIS